MENVTNCVRCRATSLSMCCLFFTSVIEKVFSYQSLKVVIFAVRVVAQKGGTKLSCGKLVALVGRLWYLLLF